MRRLIACLGLALGLAFGAFAWAGTAAAAGPQVVAAPVQPVTVSGGGAAASSADRIQAIEVVGNQRVEKSTVLSYLDLSVGDPFNPDRINHALKTLFATGLFADVSIERQGNSLVVRVAENPIINQIAFEGNKHLSDDTLKAEVQLKPRTVFTRAKVEADVQRLIQLYRRSGRFAATVDPKIIKLPQNRVNLVFEIHEGDKTRVARIRFIGNVRFSQSRLREVIATKQSRWYRFLSTDDTYDPDRLTYDRELLRRFYLSHGYADFRVLSAVAELTPDRNAFFITFTISEGKLYKFGKIAVHSNIKDVDTKALTKVLLTEEGDTYNAAEVEKSIDAMTDLLGTKGFAFVDIEPQIKRDPKKRTIGITYQVNEGPRVYVQRINITGNVRTEDKVIRREMRLSEGDAFNTAKLRRSKERIRALGFFEKVEVNQAQGSAPDRTVIDVNVQEKSTGSLSFGVGYSTTESVLGTIGLQEKNILGTGQAADIQLELSGKTQYIDAGYTIPYFLGYDMTTRFDVFRQRTDFQTQSSFDETSTGFNLRSTFPITEHLSETVGYSLRQDTISSVPSNASPFIQEEIGSRITSAVSWGLTYDRRDDKIEPTSGYILKGTETLAGVGGNVRNLRTDASAAYYYPVATHVTAMTSIQGGYVHGLDQRVDLNSRFFIGGDQFRGFADSGIGPRDSSTHDALGGNIYYIGTAELSFPIGLPNEFGILGRVFTQAGSLFGIDESGPNLFDSSAIRIATGVGLSWRSPLGPLRVDVAVPIRKQSLDKTEVFRISFGTQF